MYERYRKVFASCISDSYIHGVKGEELMKPILKSKRVIITIVIVVIVLTGIITTVSITGSNTSRTAAKQLSLGEKYLSELNYEKAIIAFNKVIEIEPRNIKAYMGLSEAYTGLNQTDEAIRILVDAIEVIEETKEDIGESPDYSEDVYLRLAELYEKSGNSEMAFKISSEGYKLFASDKFAQALMKDSPVVNVSVPSGTYYTEQTVKLISDSKIIHYTLDGSIPDDSSMIYDGEIVIEYGETVLTVAAKNEFGYFGEVYSFSYNIVRNTYGNTIGNMANGGYVAQQGDWIYYYDRGYGLSKIKIDETNKTLITDDHIENINVIGDWIYYINGSDQGTIYKIRTDGTEKTKICNMDLVWDLIVVADWMYYSKYDSNTFSYKLYKMKTDGTEQTMFSTNDSYDDFIVVDGWIYYSNGIDQEYLCSLYKMRVDGSDRIRLNDTFTGVFNVINDWIYYRNVSDLCLCKMRTNGTEFTRLNNEDSYFINVFGDWIYYVTSDEENVDKQYLCKSKIDGTERTVIKEGKFWTLNIANGWIYYYSSSNSNNVLDIYCRTDINGIMTEIFEEPH